MLNVYLNVLHKVEDVVWYNLVTNKYGIYEYLQLS